MNTYKKCQGRSVVSLAEGAIVGKLDDFQFHLETRRIFGYRIKESGVFAKAGGVRADELTRIGRDVAFVQTEDSVDWDRGARAVTKDRVWASQYKGTRVMSRGGKMMGQVQDLVFDEISRLVVAIFLDSGRWILLEEGEVATGPAAVIVGKPDLVRGQADDPKSEDMWARLKDAVSGSRGGDEGEE